MNLSTDARLQSRGPRRRFGCRSVLPSPHPFDMPKSNSPMEVLTERTNRRQRQGRCCRPMRRPKTATERLAILSLQKKKKMTAGATRFAARRGKEGRSAQNKPTKPKLNKKERKRKESGRHDAPRRDECPTLESGRTDPARKTASARSSRSKARPGGGKKQSCGNPAAALAPKRSGDQKKTANASRVKRPRPAQTLTRRLSRKKRRPCPRSKIRRRSPPFRLWSRSSFFPPPA